MKEKLGLVKNLEIKELEKLSVGDRLHYISEENFIAEVEILANNGTSMDIKILQVLQGNKYKKGDNVAAYVGELYK